MSFFVAGGLWKTGTSKAWYFMIACLLTDCCSLQFSVLVKQLVECFWQNILDHIALLSWCWCKIVFFIFCYLSFLWPSYTFPFFYDKLLIFFFFSFSLNSSLTSYQLFHSFFFFSIRTLNYFMHTISPSVLISSLLQTFTGECLCLNELSQR